MIYPSIRRRRIPINRARIGVELWGFPASPAPFVKKRFLTPLFPEVLSELGQEVEGVATARELHRLAGKLDVDMPITEQVYRVLYENLPPQDAVEALLKREPRQE